MAKILIITGCANGCRFCAYVLGTARCIHPAMENRVPDDTLRYNDSCRYQIVPTEKDSIHENCPLADYEEVTV